MPSPISRLLRWFLVALVLSVVGTLSFAAGQGDSPIYVNAAASGANNGTSWQNAYPDLQAALAAATAGQQIWVAAGTYKPTAGTDRAISFKLKAGVAIYGGFAGGETALEQRNWRTHGTVLSGDLLGNDEGLADIYGNYTMKDNSYHVVTHDNAARNDVVLDGFTITRGFAGDICCGQNNYYGQDNNKGGGVYNRSGSPSLNHLILLDNWAGDEGGGMYEAGSATLNDVVFTGCTALNQGGGMWNAGHTTLNDTVFHKNTGYVGAGMGIQDGSSATLNRAVFTANALYGTAGAALYNAGETHLFDVTISEQRRGRKRAGKLRRDHARSCDLCGEWYITDA